MLIYTNDGCCGLTRASGFHHWDPGQDLPRLRELTERNDAGQVRAVIGTINQRQYEDLWNQLSDAGWRVVMSWVNRNSARRVYLITFCPDFQLTTTDGVAEIVHTPAVTPSAPRSVTTYQLVRLRFNDHGVADELIELRNFGAARPTDQTVQETIDDYKATFRRTNTDRMRFQLKETTTVEVG